MYFAGVKGKTPEAFGRPLGYRPWPQDRAENKITS